MRRLTSYIDILLMEIFQKQEFREVLQGFPE